MDEAGYAAKRQVKALLKHASLSDTIALQRFVLAKLAQPEFTLSQTNGDT